MASSCSPVGSAGRIPLYCGGGYPSVPSRFRSKCDFLLRGYCVIPLVVLMTASITLMLRFPVFQDLESQLTISTTEIEVQQVSVDDHSRSQCGRVCSPFGDGGPACALCVELSSLVTSHSSRLAGNSNVPNAHWRWKNHGEGTFENLFAVYNRYHSYCFQLLHKGSPTLDRDSSCKFLVYRVNPRTAGLANRFLNLASLFVYALVTKRVLLLDKWTDVDVADLLDEPFQESSWHLPKGLSFDGAATLSNLGNNPSPQGSTRCNRQDGYGGCSLNVTLLSGAQYALDHRLLMCGSADNVTAADDVANRFPWLVVMGNQYVLPALFVNRLYRATLEELFPSRSPLAQVLPLLLLPSAAVRSKVEAQAAAFQPQSKMMSWQIRRAYKGLNHSISSCGIAACQLGALDCRSPSTAFVVSLHSVAHEAVESVLQSFCREGPGGGDGDVCTRAAGGESSAQGRTEIVKEGGALSHRWKRGGEGEKRRGTRNAKPDIKVVHGSQYGKEQHSVDQFTDAFAEMISLGQSDVLFTSRVSTFGYVARVLQGAKPAWVLPESATARNRRRADSPVSWNCVPAQQDACYHVPPKVGCRGEELSMRTITEVTDGIIGPCVDCGRCWHLRPKTL